MKVVNRKEFLAHLQLSRSTTDSICNNNSSFTHLFALTHLYRAICSYFISLRSTCYQTMCNVESSRSHGVFCVRVISAEPTPWGGEVTRDGRLNLVDLSGSENIKRSGAVGARAKEAAAIGQVQFRSFKGMPHHQGGFSPPE